MRSIIPATAVLALLALYATASGVPSSGKKLIEFGWDEPDTRFLRRHIAELQASPFDGCVFHVNFRSAKGDSVNLTWALWGRRRFSASELDSARADLRATPFGRFRENFLRVNVTPDGKYVIASGKLSPTVTIIDAHTLKIVAEPEVGLGPLHTTFDDRGNAFTSLFLDSQVVKWNIDKAVKGAPDYIVDRINVHYNIGHLQAVGGDSMHPAGDYLLALNKLSKDQYLPVGPDLPENQEIIDISGEKMKMLASFPTPPEPHDATFLAASVLKPIVKQVYTPTDDAVAAGKESVVRTGPHSVAVNMTLIRSAYTPDSFEVREGDVVTMKVTNVETIRDMIHGFALPDHNLNMALPPGYTKTMTFAAGKPGVYWYYCTNFCSALHLEMRGRMVVQPKDSTVTLTDWHAAENVKGQIVPGVPSTGDKQ